MGATDAPVTIDEFEEVLVEMADDRFESCDVLGWESEMGLHYTIGETARRCRLDLRPLQIPMEITDPRSVNLTRFVLRVGASRPRSRDLEISRSLHLRPWLHSHLRSSYAGIYVTSRRTG